MCDGDLGKWICDVTGIEDLDQAKNQVKRAIEIMGTLPRIGALTVLISPAGVIDTIVSQNLVDNLDSLENLEMSLLGVQQGIIRTRQQMKSVPSPAPDSAEPEKPVQRDEQGQVSKEKRRRRSKKDQAVSATPEEKIDGN
jgi:hypothetical protein